MDDTQKKIDEFNDKYFPGHRQREAAHPYIPSPGASRKIMPEKRGMVFIIPCGLFIVMGVLSKDIKVIMFLYISIELFLSKSFNLINRASAA